MTCSGTIDFGGGKPGLCDGVSGFESATLILPPGSLAVALIARVGTGPWQLVGSGPTLISGTGELECAVNDCTTSAACFGDNNASTHYDVTVQVPRASVTIRKTLSGDDPGVPFAVNVSCTSTPVAVPADVGATADGEISLGANDTKSSTVQIPAAQERGMSMHRRPSTRSSVLASAR